jgi:hypothetical protein
MNHRRSLENFLIYDIKTAMVFCVTGKEWRKPIYWPFGIRDLGGMISTQALNRNWRNRAMMLTEKAQQAGKTRKTESKEASFCGGLSHSSEEVLVMRMERRGQLISGDIIGVTDKKGGYR